MLIYVVGLLDTSLDTSTTSSSGSRTPTRKSAADGVRKRLMLSTSYISSDPEDSPCPKVNLFNLVETSENGSLNAKFFIFFSNNVIDIIKGRHVGYRSMKRLFKCVKFPLPKIKKKINSYLY